jgi:hypothetical protein
MSNLLINCIFCSSSWSSFSGRAHLYMLFSCFSLFLQVHGADKIPRAICLDTHAHKHTFIIVQLRYQHWVHHVHVNADCGDVGIDDSQGLSYYSSLALWWWLWSHPVASSTAAHPPRNHIERHTNINLIVWLFDHSIWLGAPRIPKPSTKSSSVIPTLVLSNNGWS